MSRLSIVLSLAVLASACGGSSDALSPTSPSVARAADQAFTVSGVVVGQGGTPIEGVEVRIAGRQGLSDGNGNYNLQNVPASYGGASAVKAGYAAVREILTVSGDTRFDVQLGPRVAIYAVSGVVSEETVTGPVGIEGVVVEGYSCEDVSPLPPFFSASCPVGIYQTTTTDKTGMYRLTGFYSGTKNSIALTKEGFDDPRVDPKGIEGNGQELTVSGDTRLDLRLVRR